MVGIITERYGESWNVDILAPFTATLPALAFEGVTRRNRPRLEAGDVVYARVTNAPRDADTELTCVLASGKVSCDCCSGVAVHIGWLCHHDDLSGCV